MNDSLSHQQWTQRTERPINSSRVTNSNVFSSSVMVSKPSHNCHSQGISYFCAKIAATMAYEPTNPTRQSYDYSVVSHCSFIIAATWFNQELYVYTRCGRGRSWCFPPPMPLSTQQFAKTDEKRQLGLCFLSIPNFTWARWAQSDCWWQFVGIQHHSPHAKLLIYPSSWCFLILFFDFMLRQSLDAHKITFSIRANLHGNFFLSSWKRNFPIEIFTKLHAFHSEPYDILMLDSIH